MVNGDPPPQDLLRMRAEGLKSAILRGRNQLGVAWLLPDTTKAKCARPHEPANGIHFPPMRKGRCETLPSAPWGSLPW